jgi:hypothetical protein
MSLRVTVSLLFSVQTIFSNDNRIIVNSKMKKATYFPGITAHVATQLLSPMSLHSLIDPVSLAFIVHS